MESKSINILTPFENHKGLGTIIETTPISEIFKLQWNILKESVSLPSAVLDSKTIDHNLKWMENFLSKFETKILLAPHGKTTMMPSLFHKVSNMSNVWGITLATAVQVKTAQSFGISKTLLANQLVGQRNMEIISEIIDNDSSFEFLCVVDSAENVKQLGNFFSKKNQQIRVLLEYGPMGGRTGIRDEIQEENILTALQKWSSTVKLVGIEFYEGILATEESIRNFIQWVTSRAKQLITKGKFGESSSPVIITGAGSAWFDVVAEELTSFSKKNQGLNLQIILRPGCYIIHDIGLYNETTLRIQSKKLMNDTLQPALNIWTYVQSIPEPNLAIIAFGKRDGALDCGFPNPKLHFRPGVFEKPINISSGDWKIQKMMDQHTFMEIQEGDDIAVGDMIAFDIAHPCTTIDKWKNVLVMDQNYNITDIYPTFF